MNDAKSDTGIAAGAGTCRIACNEFGFDAGFEQVGAWSSTPSCAAPSSPKRSMTKSAGTSARNCRRSSGDVPPEKAMRFDAVLRRSFVPEAFHDEIRRHISKELSAFERLELAMQGDVQAWVSSAMQEALGVMLGQEARRMEPSAAEPFRDAAVSHIELAIDGMDIPLAVDVFCECAVAAKLATNLIGVPLVFEDGGDDVLGELTNTVAGRIVSTLGANGFASRMGLPVTGRAPPERVTSDGGAVYFDAPPVGVFIVRLSLGDVAPAAPGVRVGRPREDGSGPIVDETTEARRVLRRLVE